MVGGGEEKRWNVVLSPAAADSAKPSRFGHSYPAAAESAKATESVKATPSTTALRKLKRKQQLKVTPPHTIRPKREKQPPAWLRSS